MRLLLVWRGVCVCERECGCCGCVVGLWHKRRRSNNAKTPHTSNLWNIQFLRRPYKNILRNCGVIWDHMGPILALCSYSFALSAWFNSWLVFFDSNKARHNVGQISPEETRTSYLCTWKERRSEGIAQHCSEYGHENWIGHCAITCSQHAIEISWRFILLVKRRVIAYDVIYLVEPVWRRAHFGRLFVLKAQQILYNTVCDPRPTTHHQNQRTKWLDTDTGLHHRVPPRRVGIPTYQTLKSTPHNFHTVSVEPLL